MKTAQQLVAQAKSQITELSVDDVQKAYSKTDIIIDIREPEEYTTGHLQGAVNIPRGLLEFKIGELANVSADSKIILYCKTSSRSALATVTLESMGYQDVYSLEGGYEAWVEAGKPID